SYQGKIGPPKTDAGIRDIVIPEWVLSLIEDWTRFSGKRHEDLLFGTRRNRPDNPNNILRRQIYPACQALGIPNASWLTFRRTFSSLAHAEGVSPRTI